MAVLKNNIMVGKPKKYPTADLLQTAIQEYFDSITYFEEAYNMVEDFVEKGKMHYKKEYLNDVNGKPIMIKKFATPPLYFQLCKMLDISRDTLLAYGDDNTAPRDYVEVVKNARDTILAYHESQLTNKIGATGSMFYLKCNNKWVDRQYIETKNTNLTIDAELEQFLKLGPEEQIKLIDEMSDKAKADITK
jgi:hypothetical protein